MIRKPVQYCTTATITPTNTTASPHSHSHSHSHSHNNNNSNSANAYGSQRCTEDHEERPYINVSTLQRPTRYINTCSTQPLRYVDLKQYDGSDDAIDTRAFLSGPPNTCSNATALYTNINPPAPSSQYANFSTIPRRFSVDDTRQPSEEYMLMTVGNDLAPPALPRKRVSTVSGVVGRSYRDEFALPANRNLVHSRSYGDSLQQTLPDEQYTTDGYLRMTVGRHPPAHTKTRLAPPANVRSRISPEANYVNTGDLIGRQPFENLLQHQHHLSASRLTHRSSVSSDDDHSTAAAITAPIPVPIPAPASKPGLLKRLIRRNSSKKSTTSLPSSSETSFLASVSENRKERKSNDYHSIASLDKCSLSSGSSDRNSSSSNRKGSSSRSKKKAAAAAAAAAHKSSDILNRVPPVPLFIHTEAPCMVAPPLPHHARASSSCDSDSAYMCMTPSSSITSRSAPTRSTPPTPPTVAYDLEPMIWCRSTDLHRRHIHNSGGLLLRNNSMTSQLDGACSTCSGGSGVRVINDNDNDRLRVVEDNEAPSIPVQLYRRTKSHPIKSPPSGG